MDTKGKSECKVKFHFLKELIVKQEVDNLAEFDWDVNGDPQQRLYLSRDTTKLMEVINGFIGTVYYRVDVN